jgi:hypothetical protein
MPTAARPAYPHAHPNALGPAGAKPNRRLCRRAGADWFFDKSLELDEVVRLAAMLARLRAGEQGGAKHGRRGDEPAQSGQ